MNVYGKMPKQLYESLKRLDVAVNDVQIVGDDIDLMFDSNGTSTLLYAIYVGNGKWLIDELEDDLNLFPALQESDTIGLDAVTKQFVNSINSSLILSFNPLGRVKYGIKDKIDKVKDVGRKVVDWATDKLYAEDAEKWLRTNGPYRRTFTDKRDGKTRVKKDYGASNINVGKLESLGKQGHYKVLTGNPDTQDFQVWHLYKNGNKIQCLDVKTGLQPQEAQWVYDNNIPKKWSEQDWNPSGEIPEKANKIEVQEVDENEEDNVIDKNVDNEVTDETVDEDNVTEEPVQETETPEEVEEEDNLHEFVEAYYNDKDDDEVDNAVMNSLLKSSIEDSDSDFGGYIDEDNVLESTPKKKSKYNGMNVTGCTESDGSVVMASLDENNVVESAPNLIKCSLILNNIQDFQKYLKNYKLEEKPKKVLTDILTRLVKIPSKDRNNITESSNNNVLLINFGKTDLTSENYIAQFEVYDDEISAKVNLGSGNVLEGDDAITMCEQTLDSIINSQKQSQ